MDPEITRLHEAEIEILMNYQWTCPQDSEQYHWALSRYAEMMATEMFADNQMSLEHHGQQVIRFAE